MTDTHVTCQDCGWTGPETETEEFADFWSRVSPGEIMPYGDCPACGAFCHATTEPQTVLAEVETALGENLQWLTDKLDLTIRQQDEDTLRRLAQLNAAWISVCRAIKQK